MTMAYCIFTIGNGADLSIYQKVEDKWKLGYIYLDITHHANKLSDQYKFALIKLEDASNVVKLNHFETATHYWEIEECAQVTEYVTEEGYTAFLTSNIVCKNRKSISELNKN